MKRLILSSLAALALCGCSEPSRDASGKVYDLGRLGYERTQADATYRAANALERIADVLERAYPKPK